MLKKILKRLNFFKKNEEEDQLKKCKVADKSKEIDKKDKNKSNTPDDIYPLW